MRDRVLLPILVFVGCVILLYVTFTVISPKNEWTETTTDISVARSLLRDCTKEFNGTAIIETKWADDIPTEWIIKCEFEAP